MSVSKTKNSYQKRVLKDKLANGRTHVNCCFCKRRLSVSNATLEHIIPLAYGGTWNIDNLALSCKDCNNDRGVAVFDEYRSWRRGRLQIKPNTNLYTRTSDILLPSAEGVL